VKRQASDTYALTKLCDAFHLPARNWTNIWNVPADARERFYDGNDHDHQKHQMHERCDNCPEKYQDAADTWNRSKDRMHNGRDNVKKKPRATKDDRLHGVETDEAVALFENIKNDAPDQWNAGDGRSHVRRQTG